MHRQTRLGLFACLSLLLLTGCCLRTEGQTTICAELLAQLAPKSDSPKLEIGGKQLTVGPSYLDRVQHLKKEIEKAHQPGVVVYCPVLTDKGIANIRFETQGDGKPPREDVVAETSMTKAEFITRLRSAQQPSSEFFRQGLRELLFPNSSDDDRGKTLFLRDIAFFDILPTALGRDDAIMLGTPSLVDALDRRQGLSQTKISPGKFTAIIGYPETEADYMKVFGREAGPDLENWRGRGRDFAQTADQFGVARVQGEALKQLGSPAGVLNVMQEAEGIVFIAAHASGCNVMLPGSGSWAINPSQVSSLKFRHKPFVMLRICNAPDPGFVRAFLIAGASGVWRNSGKIDAAQANEEARSFFANLSRGMTIAKAIENSGGPSSKLTTGLFTWVEETRLTLFASLQQ